MGRVLVIEDEPGARRLIARVLEQDGHEVVTAPNGAEGIRLACTEEWDLVVLDLLLPDIPGTTVLSVVVEQRPDQRVMIVSAVGDTESRVTCLERGAIDYVGKPFAIRELRARVRTRLLAPRAAPNSDAIDLGSLHLDVVRRRLRLNGHSIELSPREFLLLQHLMRRPGAVCTRQELLTEVWGYAFDPGSNVVDVTIARLRAKLHNDDVIETVRNVGYSIAG